jgi:hypothetical protein
MMNDMKIIFKDHDEKEISEAESKMLDEYSKEFLLHDGSVKREETYFKRALERIAYYKNAGETDAEAIEQLKPYGVSYNIRHREKYGDDFTVINVDSYTENLLTAKSKFLADATDFIMCIQPVSLETGAPIYRETIKYLGEYSNDLEPNYCKLCYDKTGNIAYIDYNYVRDYESELFEFDRIPLIREKFEISDELYKYYLTAELLPPLQ